MRFGAYLIINFIFVCIIAAPLDHCIICSMLSTNSSRLPVVFISHGGPGFFMDANPGERYERLIIKYTN